MRSLMNEFKQFALRGNVMNLAVGVMVGAAFQDIITSLTENILSPVIGLFIQQNFDSLEWHLFGVTIGYGAFITSVVNFLILALVVFFLVRAMNRLFANKEAAVKEPDRYCPFCKTTIHKEATRCPNCTSVLKEPLLPSA